MQLCLRFNSQSLSLLLGHISLIVLWFWGCNSKGHNVLDLRKHRGFPRHLALGILTSRRWIGGSYTTKPNKNRLGSQALCRGYLAGTQPGHSNLLAHCHYLNPGSVMSVPCALFYCPLGRKSPSTPGSIRLHGRQAKSCAPEPLIFHQQ